MYSYGSRHMAAQKQDDQLERTFSSYVRIQDVVLKTYLGRWTIGRSGERGSGISVLSARSDDDDDDVPLWFNNGIYLLIFLFLGDILFYINLFIYFRKCPWCNGYPRRKWTWRHGFKSWTRLIAFRLALIPWGKVWSQLFSPQLRINSQAD